MDSEKSGVPQKNRDFLQQKKSGGFFSDIVKPLRWSVTSKLNPSPKMGPDFFALTVYIYWPTTLLFHRCRAFSMPHRRHQYLIFFFPTSARKQNNPLPPCASASRLEERGGGGKQRRAWLSWLGAGAVSEHLLPKSRRGAYGRPPCR